VLSLGCCDADTSDDARNNYLRQVEVTTRLPMDQVAGDRDKLVLRVLAPAICDSLSIRQLQQALSQSGFLPAGRADGIYGYRTRSALRLFQEYVRSIENLSCMPDGMCGPQSRGHLQRWLVAGQQADWALTKVHGQSGQVQSAEYAQWLALLQKVRERCTVNPPRELQLARMFNGATDTRDIADWDFDPRHIHLLGIRRHEFSGKFDDILVLLIRGLVFKFQGSTEPGYSTHKRGKPWLVRGQHEYHFGWHQKKYLALRPRDRGVLVVRSNSAGVPDDNDIESGLSANPSINIHWGGQGGLRDVYRWSAGCQVVNGALYVNHRGQMVDCRRFVARNNSEVGRDPAKTRGAYNVLQDLVIAFFTGSTRPLVKYTLLTEQDLELDPMLKLRLATVRGQAYAHMMR
jgi:hypothetical protein